MHSFMFFPLELIKTCVRRATDPNFFLNKKRQVNATWGHLVFGVVRHINNLTMFQIWKHFSQQTNFAISRMRSLRCFTYDIGLKSFESLLHNLGSRLQIVHKHSDIICFASAISRNKLSLNKRKAINSFRCFNSFLKISVKIHFKTIAVQARHLRTEYGNYFRNYCPKTLGLKHDTVSQTPHIDLLQSQREL